MGSKSLTMFLTAVLSVGVAAGARAEDKKDEAADRHAPTFAGRVEPAEQAGIQARVAGTVDKVNVDIGDRVKKGQVLIELSAPELNDQLDQAKARVEQAMAQVEQTRAARQAAEARLAQADAARDAAWAGVKHAKAGADQAQAEVDRMKQLAATAAVSRQELDVQLHQADAAKASVEEAEAEVKTAAAARDAAAAEVAQAEAGVKAAEAGVDVARAVERQAETQLGYTRISAPFDGVVARRLVDTGAVVGPPWPGQTAPLLTVMRDDVLHVAFDVDERGAWQVAAGGAAVIHSLGKEFLGKVTRTAGAFNPDTGTLRIEIDLPNPDGKLRPGAFVTVELKKTEPGK